MIHDCEDCDPVCVVGTWATLTEEPYVWGSDDATVEVCETVGMGVIHSSHDTDPADLVHVLGIGMFEAGGLISR